MSCFCTVPINSTDLLYSLKFWFLSPEDWQWSTEKYSFKSKLFSTIQTPLLSNTKHLFTYLFTHISPFKSAFSRHSFGSGSSLELVGLYQPCTSGHCSPHSSFQNCSNSGRLHGDWELTAFFKSTHKFSIGLRSDLATEGHYRCF